jgi:hypothetical protein
LVSVLFFLSMAFAMGQLRHAWSTRAERGRGRGDGGPHRKKRRCSEAAPAKTVAV